MDSSATRTASQQATQATSFIQRILQKQASLQASKLGAIISSASGTIKDVNVEVQKRRPNGYVERLGTGLSDYLDTASNYLTSTDGATLLSDLETFAIAQPVAAVAVAAALGFVSARVVKVSNSSGPTT